MKLITPKTVTIGAVAALMLAASACTPAENARRPEAKAEATVAAETPDVHPFRIGTLQAWALRDGTIVLPAGGADVPWRDAGAVTAALTAAGQPTDAIPLSIQPLLIRDGDRLVLIDTGAGGAMGTEGSLQASLAAAGVTPDQVTDVLISHYHEDHIGGLATADGALAFPNATIHISAADWAVMQGHAPAAVLVQTITPKVQTFAPGAVVAPGITAVPLAGHTEGHTGYEIVSGADRLIYIGDALHSSLLSIGHPDWPNAWDVDGAAGVATRQALLERAASQNLRVYGGHFAWPGVGHIQKAAQGYVWVPET